MLMQNQNSRRAEIVSRFNNYTYNIISLIELNVNGKAVSLSLKARVSEPRTM